MHEKTLTHKKHENNISATTDLLSSELIEKPVSTSAKETTHHPLSKKSPSYAKAVKKASWIPEKTKKEHNHKKQQKLKREKQQKLNEELLEIIKTQIKQYEQTPENVDNKQINLLRNNISKLLINNNFFSWGRNGWIHEDDEGTCYDPVWALDEHFGVLMSASLQNEILK